jgi:hypothetical protein
MKSFGCTLKLQELAQMNEMRMDFKEYMSKLPELNMPVVNIVVK